ncbi:MAG: SIMPL domain-containing protein [Anaerolineales bacterium]
MKFRNPIKILLFLAAAGLLAACGSAEPVVVDENEADRPNTVTVVGEGQAFGEPDQASVRLGHVARNPSVSQAIEASNEAVRQITEALQDAGVAPEDIQTTNFSVLTEEPEFPEPRLPETSERTESAQSERIYRVENTVLVTVREVDQVGAVIEAALNAGANSVQGLRFSLSNRSQLAAEARQEAVANAREQASQLAGELDLSLGDVLSVNEQSSGAVSPVMEAAMGRGGDVPISEGTLSVNSRVEITFSLIAEE